MSDVIGRTPFEVGHSPELADQVYEAFSRTRDSGERVSGVFEGEGSHGFRRLEYSFSPHRSGSGEIDIVVGWSREIT